MRKDNLRRIKTIISLSLALCWFSASAQFYQTGQNPASQKWSVIKSPTYKLIYPRGCDSLAQSYARTLELIRPSVGATIGYLPNEKYENRMPVLLFNAEANPNGLVVWTPRRIELLTGPDAYSPEPNPWVKQLTIHESRHVAQMQYSNSSKWKWLRYLSGEALGGALSLLYGNSLFYEGDAVIAETALTASGRGRTADFLEYYRVALDKNDPRDWYQWYYGNFAHYVPNNYALGYMYLGGARYTYNNPYIVNDFYNRLLKSWMPLPFCTLFTEASENSGKNKKDTWSEVSEQIHQTWQRNDSLRGGSFMTADTVITPGRFYSQFQGTVSAGIELYAIRTGIAQSPELVRIDSLGAHHIRPWAASTSKLAYDPRLGRLYWSETVYDSRWEHVSTSRIRYMLAGTYTQHDLTTEGRLYNPAVCDTLISATEYPVGGGSAIVLLSSFNGAIEQRFIAPDNLQVVESAWLGGKLYASAISEAGIGIYEVSESGFDCVLEPQPVKVKEIRAGQSELTFVSDRTTVNELYSFNPSTGIVCQVSNTRYGASDFASTGSKHYFSLPDISGKPLASIDTHSLPVKKVDFSEVYSYELADTLSAQENRAYKIPVDTSLLQISEPRNYHRALHLLKIHSWAPLFVDVDEVMNMSFGTTSLPASLGATVFFQNDLSTLYGGAGVSFNDNFEWNWNPKAHVYFTYAGMYPKFDVKFNFGGSDRKAYNFYDFTKYHSRTGMFSWRSADLEGTTYDGSIRAYVPINLSKGGWVSGVIPQLTYSFSNDVLYKNLVELPYWAGREEANLAMKYTQGAYNTALFMQKVNATFSAYSRLSKPQYAVFPRWGIGTQMGFYLRPGAVDVLTPSCYGILYGYVPGALPLHAMKLTLTGLHQYDGYISESSTMALPTGFNTATALAMNSKYPSQIKASVEYGMPFADLCFSKLRGATYVKHLESTIHADGTLFSGGTQGTTTLFGVGLELNAVLGNLWFVNYDFHIGISYSYLGGSAWNMLVNGGAMDSHHIFSPVLKFDF